MMLESLAPKVGVISSSKSDNATNSESKFLTLLKVIRINP